MSCTRSYATRRSIFGATVQPRFDEAAFAALQHQMQAQAQIQQQQQFAAIPDQVKRVSLCPNYAAYSWTL